MKKSFKLLALCLIIVGLFVTKLLYTSINNRYWRIKLEKISDGVYKYHMDLTDNQYASIRIINGDIYYILHDSTNGNYTLYKRDIRRNEDTQIGVITGSKDYCLWDNNFIQCREADVISYYDLGMNTIYEREYDAENLSSVVYHDHSFLTIKENKIYKDDELVKELDIDMSDAFFSKAFMHNGNSYLIYYVPSEISYIYYDIINDRYSKQDKMLSYPYDMGYYNVTNDNLLVYNVVEDKEETYINAMHADNLYTHIIVDNHLYIINENRLINIDLDLQNLSIYEYEFVNSNGSIDVHDNYAYITLHDGVDCDIYVMDLNTSPKTTFTYDEYKKYNDDLIATRVKEIEDKYHIDIVYGDDVNIENETFKTSVVNNSITINKALDKVEEVAGEFNKEFFDRFFEEDYKGVIIDFSGKIHTNSDTVNTVSQASGYSLNEAGKYEVVIDITQSSLKNIICHELMHNIERKMNYNLTEWHNMNPSDFTYLYDYRNTATAKYTMFEVNYENVYFVDTYSKSYMTEDVARVFENICGAEGESFLIKYPHLFEKGMYLKNKMLEEFPSLKEATVFDSIDVSK